MINGSLSFEKIKEQVQNFRRLCVELGICVTDGNAVAQRLQAAEQFCSATSAFQEKDADFLRLVGEFLFLAPCVEKLKDQLKGKDHLSILIRHDTYASKVLELRAAFMVELVGYRALLGEPDVVVDVAGETVGLACKKLTSIEKLPARVSEGRDQIIKSGKTGIVVMDIADIPEYPSAPIYRSEQEAFEGLALSTAQRSEAVRRKIPQKLAGTAAGSVLFINDQYCGVIRSLDHQKRIRQCVPFASTHMFFNSRTTRSKPIETLENAIIPLGSNRPPQP
jgi:hypothetical protein